MTERIGRLASTEVPDLLESARARYVALMAEQVSRYPDDPGTHLCLGRALEKADRLDEAMGCYRHALELAPDDEDIQARIAAVALRGRRRKKERARY